MKWKKTELEYIESHREAIENLDIFRLAEEQTKNGFNTSLPQKVSWAIAYTRPEVKIFFRLKDVKVSRAWGEDYLTNLSLYFNNYLVGKAKFAIETTHPKIITNFCKNIVEKTGLPEEVAFNIESRAEVKIIKMRGK